MEPISGECKIEYGQLIQTKSRIRCVVGGGGIRTHETFSRLHAFQASSIGHSNTPPQKQEHANKNQANNARISLAKFPQETDNDDHAKIYC